MSTLLESRAVGLGVRPALLVVDMTRGFTESASPLGHECNEAVHNTRRVLEVFRERSWPIVFTTVAYENASEASVFRQKLPALNVLTTGSHWTELDPRLDRQAHEWVVLKKWASAFFATDLAAHLTELAVDSIVLTGLTTSGCVRATGVDALQHNFRTLVIEECVSDRDKNAHFAALHDLSAKYCDVWPLHRFFSQLQSNVCD